MAHPDPDPTPLGSPGRPRSESARRAVLHAVDDMLVETGYSAMTMKGIAERAGVGRQTVYRWWSTKAEILLEASVADAATELATAPQAAPLGQIITYLTALNRFLTTSPAGLAYRALLGEAQHDPAVAKLVHDADLVNRSTNVVLDRLRPFASAMPDPRLAAAQLTGPSIATLLTTGTALPRRLLVTHAETLLAGWQPSKI